MPAPDPSRILDTLCAYWQTNALKAAIDIGMFTALGRRARTTSQLAEDCGAGETRLRSLCDVLVALGFLHKRNGRYRSTVEAARFLDARSPETLAAVSRFFNAPQLTAAFSGLAATIRGDRSPGAASDPRMWREFAAATLALRHSVAQAIADALLSRRLVRGRILDVGAGASPAGIELLARTRATALVVQDRPAVVEVALRHAATAGVRDRVAALRGDAITVDWGGPFDLVLMVNVLDYFDASARARLVRKAHAALGSGGTLAVYAPLLNESRTSPPDAVAYSLLLLALRADGHPSTFRELKGLLRGARFAPVTRCRGLPLVLARKKT
jgi:SAM-dependent methyltransferase